MSEQTDRMEKNLAALHGLMEALPGSRHAPTNGPQGPLAPGRAAPGLGVSGGRPFDGQLAQRVTAARCEVSVREATLDDVPFVDGLQKMHSHMVGFMPRKQLEKYVEDGHVLIAEGAGGSDGGTGILPVADARTGRMPVPPNPIGYIIAKDQYMKRDDVGIVYQLNVMPMKQRHLIGATLVKAVFERAAYGCKLFCCWCAQDIQANWFWESIGFVPLAFRTGSRAKQRIHIFWQRRIRAGDEGPGATPYWYPHQTQNGAVAEDRIVLPIPPGTHWRDAKPLVLPQVEELKIEQKQLPETLPGGASVKARPAQEQLSAVQKALIHRMQARELGGAPLGKKAVITTSGVRYVDRTDYVPELDAPEELKAMEEAEKEAKQKKKRVTKKRGKSDPKLVKAARELRDRYLDEVNSGRLLPPSGEARYDVSRQLASGTPGGDVGGGENRTVRVSQVSDDRLLDAA